jgi:hypothetical protein
MPRLTSWSLFTSCNSSFGHSASAFNNVSLWHLADIAKIAQRTAKDETPHAIAIAKALGIDRHTEAKYAT